MSRPPFVPRPGNPGESICTKCGYTVRAEDGCTLEDAQQNHECQRGEFEVSGDPPMS